MKKPVPGVIYSEAELRQLLGWREQLRRKLRRLLRWCGLSKRPDRDLQAQQPLPAASEASEIRLPIKPVIRMELVDNGLITVRTWKGGLPDSVYPPRSLEMVIHELSRLVPELQQPDSLSSPDEHAH